MRIITASAVMAGFLLLPAVANATPCDLTLIPVATALGATCDGGLAPTGVFGTVTGGYDGSGFQTSPLDGLADYSYFVPSPTPATAGNTTDFSWVYEDSGSNPSFGTQWSFGVSSSQFILYPTVDHGPTWFEGLEGSLWGWNGTDWILGTVVKIWEQGFNATSLDDNPASLWSFGFSTSQISLTNGLSQNQYVYNDGDAEIDAVAAAVPEPATLSLLGIGVIALVGRRRRSVPVS